MSVSIELLPKIAKILERKLEFFELFLGIFFKSSIFNQLQTKYFPCKLLRSVANSRLVKPFDPSQGRLFSLRTGF